MISDKQKEALKELIFGEANYPFYGGAAGGGKTWIGCIWLFNMCFDYPNSRWFIGRDSLKDTRQSVMITWLKVAKDWGFENWKFGDNSIVFDNGSNIDFLDLSFYPQKDPFFERFGSKEYTGGWIEEAGETRFEAFDVLKSRIGRHLNAEYNIKPKIFITANPKKNWLYTEFYKPFINNSLPATHSFIQALHTHNPFLTEDYRKALESITDKVRRQRLLLGNFDYDDSDNSLINFDKIQDIYTNTFALKGQKFMSADIALLNDRLVIYIWDGLCIIDMLILKGIESNVLAEKMVALAEKHQVPRSNIIYDADGIGGYLRGYLPGALPFNNNASAGSPEFPNIKTRLYYLLAEKINNNEIFIECQTSETFKSELIEELQMVKTKESDTKYAIMGKTEVKQLLGRSPDLTDAMMLRMLFILTRHT